ncbi:MAG: RNA helicase [Phototrophicales bacterium]|nr:MAG: RNA helicase [Phototrophicales bacterium]
MAQLEQLQRGIQVCGIVPQQAVTLIDVEWSGSNAVTVVYRRSDGKVGDTLLYRENEAELEIVRAERLWAFDADGALLRLVSEAYRIHLAHLFDPILAVHTSLIEPLPHQITAVYDEMLTRQPLRFLLADDPGAGKTIMAGLLIRELIVRGDVRRCLICAPGSLTEQWQDELWAKFQLNFTIMTREMVETSRSGNPFAEQDLIIARLDQLSRSEELQARLRQTDWDLVVCDEAHKMSASFFGGDLKETKRYRLGKLLGELTRHFLLMTATPHNGKEEDFQLFLALLDADRFEGRFRDGVHQVDVSDLMRRMVKEKLLKFDGKPLFPERKAYTVNYTLSPEERELYEAVTEYVRREFNRAEQLENDGRKGTVGFALTILQRRLASSPEAIYQSLKRRRERLEKRLKEAQRTRQRVLQAEGPIYDDDDWDDFEDAPNSEVDQIEAELIDSATAARTVEELEAEIIILRDLEAQALRVRRSGHDRKWNELLRLLKDTPEMQNSQRGQRKLVIFTEHRDTLNYLLDRLSTLIGRAEAIVTIHGGMRREERRDLEDRFRNDPDVLILLATDAAGEGINLQRAHLMVNYDLPWNPNRLEQRFGRIHRIGQTEVCHLWNLVAGETREGAVYQRLLKKLEAERHALDGQVFDVLGKLFQETPLRKLLVEAIRYGDDPAVRARLEQAVDNATDRERVRDLLEHQSLVTASMDISQVMRIREEMERAAARRLQPFYIKAFFLQAFEHFGGTIHERESGRYAINNVPAIIRNHAKERGLGAVSTRYERICFEKALIHMADKPAATFICPGHPLLNATISLLLLRERDTLKRGGILVDETDPGQELRALFYLEQTIQDAMPMKSGERRPISREVHFVEIDGAGNVREGGGAPYLDYRPATADEIAQIGHLLGAGWLKGENFERRAAGYAVEHLVPRHLERVRARRLELINKTEAAVQERLTKEINYWDLRATELRAQEQAGKVNARLNSQRAQERADQLAERLKQRKAQLAQERQISAAPPIVVGGALIIPIGLLLGEKTPPEILDRRITEQIAMRAVMEAEIALGNHPHDVSSQNLGYDIESRDGRTGRLRFIEVKGRRAGAETVTLTYNELYRALNSAEAFILALVEVDNAKARRPRYVRNYPFREPDPLASSVNFNLRDMLNMSEEPN